MTVYAKTSKVSNSESDTEQSRPPSHYAVVIRNRQLILEYLISEDLKVVVHDAAVGTESCNTLVTGMSALLVGSLLMAQNRPI